MGLAGKEASAARKLGFFILGDRAGEFHLASIESTK